VVYGSITTQEFEGRWKKLMADLGYKNNPWFNERNKGRCRYF
jgi:hypothetical protein